VFLVRKKLSFMTEESRLFCLVVLQVLGPWSLLSPAGSQAKGVEKIHSLPNHLVLEAIQMTLIHISLVRTSQQLLSNAKGP
jgi:hypothetical protein